MARKAPQKVEVEAPQKVEVEASRGVAIKCTVKNFHIGDYLITDSIPNEVLKDERLNKIYENALLTGVIIKA